MIAFEVLLILVALMFAVLVYRGLIHSRWFARLVGGLETPPETDQEVLTQMSQAEYAARRAANLAEAEAAAKKKSAAALRKQTRRNLDHDPL
jgi:hypothetical protein